MMLLLPVLSMIDGKDCSWLICVWVSSSPWSVTGLWAFNKNATSSNNDV